MKVLFINTNDTSGGAARAAMRIMRGVQQNGVDVEMFVKCKNSKASDVIPISQLMPTSLLYRVCDWIASKLKNKWHHYKWSPYQQTKQNAYLSDLRSMSCHGALRKIDYDIVHLHWINNRFLDIKELKQIRKPIVWTLHDSWPFTGICHVPYDCKKYESHCGVCPLLGSEEERDLAYEVFEKKMAEYKKLNLHIVTPSRWLENCAKKSALFGNFTIHLIPNCINTELYRPINKEEARKQLGLEPNKRYLLFGAMHVLEDINKGFELLREALVSLKDLDVELLMYGNSMDVSKYELHTPVHAFGYIIREEKMMLLYNAADVTVVPSLSENLSNTIMESLSCGTPVAAFEIGGNSDMIAHKQNGFLARERDSEDLSRGILWCLTNNTDGSLSKNARKKVMNEYTIDIVSKQYMKLYESLCKE